MEENFNFWGNFSHNFFLVWENCIYFEWSYYANIVHVFFVFWAYQLERSVWSATKNRMQSLIRLITM